MIAIDDRTILAEGDEEAPGIVETIERSNSGRLKELLNKLVEKSQIAMVISGLNQRRINAATRHLETKVAEGLGEWVARIDRTQYRAQQGIHGWNCWSDPGFIEAFLRDNPSYRLRYHAKNYVNGWSAEEGENAERRTRLREATARQAPNAQSRMAEREEEKLTSDLGLLTSGAPKVAI